eukprot:82638-Prymnesium_polylepis.1
MDPRFENQSVAKPAILVARRWRQGGVVALEDGAAVVYYESGAQLLSKRMIAVDQGARNPARVCDRMLYRR